MKMEYNKIILYKGEIELDKLLIRLLKQKLEYIFINDDIDIIKEKNQ